MKNCCLWINGKKISEAKDIKENFNIADVRGYFLGGRLAEWLYEHGADDKARMIESIDKNSNPDKALYDIFCAEYVMPQYHKGNSAPCRKNDSIVSSAVNSFATGSFKMNSSYKVSSFRSSFNNNNNNNNNRGSFAITSFNITSFRLTSFNFGSFTFGSFRAGSFKAGSFSLDKLLAEKGGSFSYDEFVNCCGFDEKQLLVYFTSEPLNRYGYGIHLI